jgi:hypothetical protein
MPELRISDVALDAAGERDEPRRNADDRFACVLGKVLDEAERTVVVVLLRVLDGHDSSGPAG